MFVFHVSIIIASLSFFSLVDDDATSSLTISSVYRIAENHHIKVCFGVIANNVAKDEEVLQMLHQYQSHGHQICNHSLTHDVLWKAPDRNFVRNEFERSKIILDSLGFYNHDYFIYPWGKFSLDVRNWLLPLSRDYFKMAFDSRGGICELDNYNIYYIHRFPLRKHENITIVKHEIDKAIKNGEWIVFLTHSGTPRDYSAEYVEEVVDYCLSNGMKCLTLQQAYDRLAANNRLRTDVTADWTVLDEVKTFLYFHVYWILSSLILVIFMIILTYFKIIRRKK